MNIRTFQTVEVNGKSIIPKRVDRTYIKGELIEIAVVYNKGRAVPVFDVLGDTCGFETVIEEHKEIIRNTRI